MLAKLFLISLFTISCIDSPFERDYRYDPNLIPPCEITSTGYSSIQTNPASFDRLWKRGPYPIWNSSPSDKCEKNLDYVTQGGKPVSLHITYPSRSNPQLSGDSIPAEGPFPIIIFGHANHDKKCSLNQSYYLLHDHWASWGFIVASYDGEEWNCQRGTKTNIRGRAALFEASIEGRLRQIGPGVALPP